MPLGVCFTRLFVFIFVKKKPSIIVGLLFDSLEPASDGLAGVEGGVASSQSLPFRKVVPVVRLCGRNLRLAG